MKPSIRYLILAGLFVSLIFFSCKTTDTGTTTPLVDTGYVYQEEDLTAPVNEYLLESLAKAKANTVEARSWAEYLNGPVHCPDDWKKTEDRFEVAYKRSGDPETKGEAYARIAEWNEIKLAYDGIFNGSFEPFLKEQEEVLAAARGKAVEAGAEELVPDRLAAADTVAAGSKQKFENGDVYGSLNTGKEAWDRYHVLETLSYAHEKQAEADEYDFFSMDPDNYKLAAEAGNKAVDLYDEGKIAESQAQATEALDRFRLVIRNGWSATVEEKASSARDLRTASQEIKANVAVRSEYNAAESVYNQAHVAWRAEKYTEAMDLFEQSEELFGVAYDKALEKRNVAEEALRRTEQKLAESEEKAQNAEDIIGGEE
jgi:hypothetical protein